MTEVIEHTCMRAHFKSIIRGFSLNLNMKKKTAFSLSIKLLSLQICEMCKLWYLHFNVFYLAHVIP